MLMLFELLMAVFMEKHTTKDSNNSSRPSSQTPEDETAVSRPGTHGKGKAQSRRAPANTRTVETVQVAQVHSVNTAAKICARPPCRT